MGKYTYKQKADVLQRMVKDLSGRFTDRQIAEKYRIPVSRIEKARQRLGIKKSGYRHKPIASGVVV